MPSVVLRTPPTLAVPEITGNTVLTGVLLGRLYTVALVLSAVVVALPALSVAVTLTFRLVASINPDTMV